MRALSRVDLIWVVVVGAGCAASCAGERPEFGKYKGTGDAASSNESDQSTSHSTADASAPDASKTNEDPLLEGGTWDAAGRDMTEESDADSDIDFDAGGNSTEAENRDGGVTNDAACDDSIGACTERDSCLEHDSSVASSCGDGLVSDGEACDVSAAWCHECQLVPAVSAGGRHTCALLTTGGVKCWGYNAAGELGNNVTSEQLAPVDVLGLRSGAAAVVAGGRHTCALLASGGVKCWGMGQFGELGNNDTSDQTIPVDVTGLSSGAAAIATGGGHTCALLTNGAIKCWGGGRYGQLGNNNTNDQWAPVDVVGLDGGVAAITAGGGHTCALLANGGVKCWGYGGLGQLGNDDTSDMSVPVDVVGLGSGVSAIAAGSGFTCALLTAGGVKCWGFGADGRLGSGDSSDTSSTSVPVDVVDIGSDASAITVGYAHACVLLTNGGVKCWGYGGFGQLGNGATASHSAPVNVTKLGSAVSTIAAGTYHTCALLENGGIKCWGNGENGRLGNNDSSGHLTPVDVIGFP